MKVYAYNLAECRLPYWPDGVMTFPDVEFVENPNDADIFISKAPLDFLNQRGIKIRDLPYFAGNEARHAFFDVSDGNNEIYDAPCLFMRANLKQSMKERDPNSVSWPWPIDDFIDCVGLPEGGFKYDVSFHGLRLSKSRLLSTASCEQSGMSTDMMFHPDFTGYYLPRGNEMPEGLRRMREFKRSMRESRVALCPEQILGDIPYRFYEAMSAGRIPVLVGSDYILPFADEIPYDTFCLQISRGDAGDAGPIIKQWLHGLSDEEIQERGSLARACWQTWLHRDDWPKHMRYTVEKHLAGLNK